MEENIFGSGLNHGALGTSELCCLLAHISLGNVISASLMVLELENQGLHRKDAMASPYSRDKVYVRV